ncbi:MAG TPA: ASCH domain-containing protein [Actinomycetaceae bacterium]|nr:ASCH domain-containing protein [Actinomycetaceae bacterium]
MTWQSGAMADDVEMPHEPAGPLDRTAHEEAVTAYWHTARKRAGLTRLGGIVGHQALDTVEPPAWSFGASPEEADELLALVLSGRKTATSSAAATYDASGEPRPEPGALSILLDGRGRPRALIATEEVEIVAYGDVGPDHAAAEGEGDRSLVHWQRVHEPFFRDQLAEVGLELTQASEILIERFRLLDPRTSKH